MSRNAMDASIDAENARDDQRETARREWLESVKAPAGYTPGPWTVEEDMRPGMEWNRHIHSGPNTAVCFMAHSDGREPERDMANARLIAAAPEMVEALKCASNVLSLLSDEVKALGCKAENVPAKVRAALAKAGVV